MTAGSSRTSKRSATARILRRECSSRGCSATSISCSARRWRRRRNISLKLAGSKRSSIISATTTSSAIASPRTGHRVEVEHSSRWNRLPAADVGEAFRHQVRWNLSIRYSRPMGHLGLIFAQGLPWTILAVILAPSPPLRWRTLPLTLCCGAQWRVL